MVVIQVIRATDPEIAVQMVGGAHPTLWCGGCGFKKSSLFKEPAEMKKNVAGALFVLFTATLISATSGDACTRAVYQGPENTVITARSMDWKDEIPANLWLDLKRADFSVNAPVLMLPLVNHESYAGDALDSFKPADPFKFAGVQ